MKRVSLLFVITIVILFASCAPAKNYSGVTVDKEKIKGKAYHNIFIIAMTADIQVRVQLETDLAKLIESRGLKAVKSVDAIPPSLSDPKMPTKEEIDSKLKTSGCDAIFIASLLKKEDNVNYTSGHQTHRTALMGNYYGFYVFSYTTATAPGYVTQDKSYLIQSNFYDVASDELMWSVESGVFAPSSLAQFSKIYLTHLVNQLEEEKVIKKTN